MKKFFLVVAVALFIIGCQSRPSETNQELPQEQKSTEQKLADSLAAAGWKNLFDGTLQGWAMYKGLDNNSWEAVDGLLHCKSFDSAQLRSDIRTAEKYADFELTFDWRVATGANSGVMYRVNEEGKEPFFSGPEYQVIDDVGYPGELEGWQLTGACYAMYAPPESRKLTPAGSWNNSRILARGNHIEHWLNGEKLFEYEINGAEWKKLRDAGKWKDELLYAQSPEGYIVFQDHKNEAWFRNIFIRKL
jgi:Domain of Unknown Function (DUF1080)